MVVPATAVYFGLYFGDTHLFLTTAVCHNFEHQCI